jgi:hypothetical protein
VGKGARLRAVPTFDVTRVGTRRIRGALPTLQLGAKPHRLRLHNPVTLPVDYAGKLWCEQRQEAQ